MAQAPLEAPEKELRDLEGTLERAGLTQVLQGFRSGRQTGVLHLDQNGDTKRVYFKNGNIVFASSDVATEKLGELLVRSGKLKRTDLELACKVRESSQLRLGKTLVDMGYLSESELDALVKNQVEGILRSLLPWETGSYRAEFRDHALGQKDQDLVRADISTENVLLEAVRGLEDSRTIRNGIGNLSEALHFARDPEWIGKNLKLTPEEGFLLSRVDGESSADEIAKLSPMGEDETLRSICALVIAGVLELESTREAAAQAAASKAQVVFTPVEPEPVPVTPPPKPTTPPAPKPQPKASRSIAMEPPPRPIESRSTPPAPTSGEPSEAARAFEEEMMKKHRSAHEVTYYELLDVRMYATPDEIKAGYFRLAKRLHPDHRAGLKVSDPDGVFDDLYLAVKAAYEVLSSETERRRYDFSISKTHPKPSVPSPEPPPSANTTKRPPPKTPPKPKGPPPRHYNAGQMARLHFSNGQRFFDEGNYHEAVEELQNAARLDGGRAEYHRLLGYALMKNPKWHRRAEACFLRVLEIDQFDIDTMISLGEIYESGGMERRARKVYEEALGLDPGNERAIAKLGGAGGGNAIDKLKGILHRNKGH